uniref:Uncharacterized protein n=1 Tax=Aegilops tauschii subsp. strangulata TaxID=200361 RepID=A0A453AMH9_AEGTS
RRQERRPCCGVRAHDELMMPEVKPQVLGVRISREGCITTV